MIGTWCNYKGTLITFKTLSQLNLTVMEWKQLVSFTTNPLANTRSYTLTAQGERDWSFWEIAKKIYFSFQSTFICNAYKTIKINIFMGIYEYS